MSLKTGGNPDATGNSTNLPGNFFPDREPDELLTITGDFLCRMPRPTICKRQPIAMISKCANPSCSKLLMRLDGGRFFGFPMRDKNAVEHFWLCLNCSK